MNALANQPFTRMNGLGNEIVVVDLRQSQAQVSPEEARAAAQPPAAAYDQLMTLHAPRTPGTDAYVRIYNNDGSRVGACGNGTRCIASLLFKETGKNPYNHDAEAVTAGFKLARAYACTHCHGRDLSGLIGPNLTSGNWRHLRNGTDKGMFQTLYFGTGAGMAAWGKLGSLS